MTSLFGGIFLGGIGLIFGAMLGKSCVREGYGKTDGASMLMLLMGIFCSCGAIWIGLLNKWI